MTDEQRQRLIRYMNENQYRESLTWRILIVLALVGGFCFIMLCLTSCAAIHDRALAVVDVTHHVITSAFTPSVIRHSTFFPP